MTATLTPPTAGAVDLTERTAPASPAGPVGSTAPEPIRMPPQRPGTKLTQTLQFVRAPLESALKSYEVAGDVWQLKLASRADAFVVTAHPDHVKSLLTANPADAPSLTGESPLRPIMGPNSVLTLVGERHMRQRKLLLPPFHGDAVARYVEMIERTVAQELDGWQPGLTFPLAERMQAVTLEVIMSGVFGIEGGGEPGSPERKLREITRRMMSGSTTWAWQLVELQNTGRLEPRGAMKYLLKLVDRRMYQVIRRRRAAGTIEGRHDVLSLLLQARDEAGRELTDEELRDELMTLLLAGHETTANSLAWTFERMFHGHNGPDAYTRLLDMVRDGDADADSYVEATIHEGMRVRPVIPFIARMVRPSWRFGEFVLPERTPVAVSIVALHHRADVYPEPHTFAPERFLHKKPGTYTWIPFGGGIRRCLGATLAMAEQRVVLRELARRVDLAAADPEPEKPRQRNVTMIPERGGRVTVQRLLAS
jgi:cytochrome P450